MDFSHYWKTVVETLHDGLMIVDASGTILTVNPAAEALTGYSAEELIGKNCRVLNCTGCKIFGTGPGVQWCGLYSKGRILSKKCLIMDKSGRTVNILKNATVLRDDNGNVIGAVETLTDITELVRREQEIQTLRQTCRLDDGFHGIIGRSPDMQKLFSLIESVAMTEAPVMIHGQSGTGKELVARAVHESGPRKDKPFIKVNCAALNENLLESELFGHVKGAYTGADRIRIGRFEAAHQGTIFLDEIGDIPVSTQVKLLRVLEEKEIERVGDHRPISVDVRIISATNKHLEHLIRMDQFREDLFFRINVFPLAIPSLSERLEDIPLLVRHFIEQNNTRSAKQLNGLTPPAMSRLLRHSWPGNVRELRNAIEYAFVLCPGGWIDTMHLPPKIREAGGDDAQNRPQAHPNDNDGEPARSEREALLDALERAGGNQSEAARRLGVSRITIWKRIKKYGIDLKSDLKPVRD
ncbi:MAG: sigma-54 interaction domain-containing protein [Desulfobacterales bacterium]